MLVVLRSPSVFLDALVVLAICGALCATAIWGAPIYPFLLILTATYAARIITDSMRPALLMEQAFAAILLIQAIRIIADKHYHGSSQTTLVALCSVIGLNLSAVARAAMVRRIFIWIFSGASLILSLTWLYINTKWLIAIKSLGLHDAAALKVFRAVPIRTSVNELAAIMIIACTIHLLCAIQSPSPTRGVASLNAVVMSANLAAILLTFSRAAYLAVTLVLMVYVGASAMSRPRRPLSSIGLPVLCIAFTLTIVGVASSGVITTFKFVGNTSQVRSATGRLYVAQVALRIFREHWIVGVGPGAFPEAYLSASGVTDEHPFGGRAPSSLIQILVERGAIGLLVSFAVLIVVLHTIRIRWQNGSPAERRRIAVICAGLGGAAIMELTDANAFHNVDVAAVYVVLFALLGHPRRSRTATNDSTAFIATATGICPVSTAAAVIVLACCCRHELAQYYAARGINTMQSTSGSALIPLKRAYRLEPSAYNAGLLATAYGKEALPEFNPSRSLDTWKSGVKPAEAALALHYYNLALSGNDQDDVMLQNRAWLRLAVGQDFQAVMRDLRRAESLDETEPSHHLSIAVILQLQGQLAAAEDEYSRALLYSPTFADSPCARHLQSHNPALWRVVVESSIQRGVVLSGHADDVTTKARLGALYRIGQNYAEALNTLRSVAVQMPSLSRVWANIARAESAVGNNDDIERSFEKSQFLDPYDGSTALELAKIQYSRGNYDAAQALENRAALLISDQFSRHATRVSALYDTHAILNDDLLPSGLLACSNPELDTSWMQ